MEKNFLNVTKCMAVVATMAVALELGLGVGADNKIKGTTDEVALLFITDTPEAKLNVNAIPIIPPIPWSRATEQMAKLKLSPKTEEVVFNSEMQVQECDSILRGVAKSARKLGKSYGYQVIKFLVDNWPIKF